MERVRDQSECSMAGDGLIILQVINLRKKSLKFQLTLFLGQFVCILLLENWIGGYVYPQLVS